MNCFEAYLVELLQGNITCDGKPVEVVRNFSNKPGLPVITLDLSPGVTTENYHRIIGEPKEKLYFHRIAGININTWCNTEEEREQVNNQIMACYYDSLNHHYRYCSQYDDGQCLTIHKPCKALNSNTVRAMKKKCPQPDTYGYECLSDKHELLYGTITIDPPFFMDEYNEHPPLLRSIFRSQAHYVEKVSELGKNFQGYEFIEHEED